MIGHYLLTLDAEQEERVLTTTFVGYIGGVRDTLCLIQVTEGIGDPYRAEDFLHRPTICGDNFRLHASPAQRYDGLCFRFGVERVNRAIRNRILANIARRTLKDVPEPARV